MISALQLTHWADFIRGEQIHFIRMMRRSSFPEEEKESLLMFRPYGRPVLPYMLFKLLHATVLTPCTASVPSGLMIMFDRASLFLRAILLTLQFETFLSSITLIIMRYLTSIPLKGVKYTVGIETLNWQKRAHEIITRYLTRLLMLNHTPAASRLIKSFLSLLLSVSLRCVSQCFFSPPHSRSWHRTVLQDAGLWNLFPC